jgi:CRISPR-associated protein Csx17
VSTSPCNLCAIPLPGLRPDSLGNYLASLGLLRLLARQWPDVRIAWKDEVLYVVGGPSDLDGMLDHLIDVSAKNEWTPYDRDWVERQKESTKGKSGAPLAEWQASAPEEHLELFAAHVVPRDRAHFNPLLGSGGNAGKRAFSDGWKKSVAELKKESAKPCGQARKELKSLLMGESVSWLLEKLNAASWFSDANKLYNCGQKPYREGVVSPWAMALACEGLPFFAGAASRRLGSRARAVGAFPFVTQAAAPNTLGEAGRDNAEVWAPIWERPMTLPEVRALFARGRAEVRGRGAITPAAFATAIVERGVDAGITGFLRFSLGHTTSANTFEPRFEGRFALPTSEVPDQPAEAMTPLAAALERILALVDWLPRDEKKKQSWRFAGLRGPIERAMIQLASCPLDPAAACGLLDALVAALDKVDRNQRYRAKLVSWDPLPIEWLPALFGWEAPPPEARLALAVVSGFAASRPFALYRFGVDWQHGRYVHPKQAPLRWVWGTGELPRVLANVLSRRVLDWEKATKDGSSPEPPARVLLPAACQHLDAWLGGQVDELLLQRWLSRLALFDWCSVPKTVGRKIREPQEKSNVLMDGMLALFGLFQPLFDLQPLTPPGSTDNLLDPESGARTPAAARRVIGLIRTGQLDAAVAFAASRYAMARTFLVKTEAPWCIKNPERLLASLLFTISRRGRGSLIQRWLRPHRDTGKGDIAYA